MRHGLIKQLASAAVLAVVCGTSQATDLFADNFDRSDNTDLNADATGKSGTLGALDWVEVVNGGDPQVLTNNLKFGESGGGGGGWSIAYPDHNFIDTGSEFTVSLDIVSAASSGGTRLAGFGVGSSKSELDNWSTNLPGDFPADFFFGYDPTGSGPAVGSYVFTNGTQDFYDATNISGGGTLSVTFSSITDFNAGTTVNYEAFINGGSVTSGSFTWSGTDENYLVLYSNYSLDRAIVDNFVVGTPGGLPGDFDGDGDVDGVDVATMFSNFNGPGGGEPTNPDTDLDNDGDCDGVDVATLFGLFTGPLTPTSVPEPTSLALLSLGGLCMARRRY